MKQFCYIIWIGLAAALASACDRTPTIELETDKTAAVKENMINANRVVIQSEATQIDAYIQRRGWKTTPLRCGARYLLLEKGKGASIQAELLEELTYGSTCWMIAPSNSAYGVVGDGDRVASRTVIVYNIQEIRKK